MQNSKLYLGNKSRLPLTASCHEPGTIGVKPLYGADCLLRGAKQRAGSAQSLKDLDRMDMCAYTHTYSLAL